MNYHTLTEEEALKKLETTENGLDESEVKKRQEQYGLNELPHKKQDSILKILISQFQNPIELILVITLIINIVFQEWPDAIALGIIIAVDVIMGTYQEWKARKDAESLINMIKSMSRVMKDGKER
jgi:magnesium-transporting ATPase (P-type)